MSNEELIAFLRENLRIELDSRDDYTGGTGGMDGPLYVRKMVIQQAVRLPNIRVRLIPCPTDGDDYFDYEVIDAAIHATKGGKL